MKDKYPPKLKWKIKRYQGEYGACYSPEIRPSQSKDIDSTLEEEAIMEFEDDCSKYTREITKEMESLCVKASNRGYAKAEMTESELIEKINKLIK